MGNPNAAAMSRGSGGVTNEPPPALPRGDDATGTGALTVDREELESAVRAMLTALGEDVSREGLADTPKRVAKAMTFAVRGYGMSAVDAVGSALFHEPGLEADEAAAELAEEEAEEEAGGGGGGGGLATATRPGVVLIRDIPFFSTAEDNLLPFYGRCHVGYVPAGGSIVGLSKVARVAEVFARRMQTPARLAADIAAAIDEGAKPRGVYVVLEAAQMGPFGPTPRTAEAALGCFEEDDVVGVYGGICGICGVDGGDGGEGEGEGEGEECGLGV